MQTSWWVPQKPGRGWVITPVRAGTPTQAHTQRPDTPKHRHRDLQTSPHISTYRQGTQIRTDITHMHARVCTHRHPGAAPAPAPGPQVCPACPAPWWSLPALPWHTPVSAWSARPPLPEHPGLAGRPRAAVSKAGLSSLSVPSSGMCHSSSQGAFPKCLELGSPLCEGSPIGNPGENAGISGLLQLKGTGQSVRNSSAKQA